MPSSTRGRNDRASPQCDAEEWAHRIEAPLIAAGRLIWVPEGSLHTFGAVLKHYETVVMPGHRAKNAHGVLVTWTPVTGAG